MIGRLLQSAASTFTQQTSSRPSTPLESVTEESHTRDLLYPELNALRSTQHNGLPLHGGRHLANAREAADFDDRGGLEMAFPSDIRIIIAQDANSRHPLPQVLFDSRPPESVSMSSEGSAQDSEAGSNNLKAVYSPVPSSARRHHTPNSSIFQSSQPQPFLPTSPRSMESRYRPLPGDSKCRASPFEAPSNEFESTQARLLRELQEETDALLVCMFGATGIRQEPGTKLHMLPRKLPEEVATSNDTPTTARPFSAGGSARRRTPLARSTSAADSYSDAPGEGSRTSSRSSVMFTRLFSVQAVESASTDADLNNIFKQRESENLPATQINLPLPQTRKDVKQKKYPRYAVSVIVQLPTDRVRSHTPYHTTPSLASSFNDVTPAASWNTEYGWLSRYMDLRGSGSTMGMTPVCSNQLSHILAHWSIITRSLEHVVGYASELLRSLLEEPPLVLAPPKKAKEPTQQSIHVSPGCLQSNARLRKECEGVGQRIVSGLRTRRVVAGQGRWGVWREEARWMERWAGRREQNFFFFNILTAFLGHHTSWLEAYISPILRDRHGGHPPSADQGVIRLQQRTVIVAADKMAARRLIFLLASFLRSAPSSVHSTWSLSPYPTMTYSESPSSMPVVRDRPLRRTINNRAGGINRGITSRDSHARSVSFSLVGTIENAEQPDTLAANGHNRRLSDTRSLRGSSLVISNDKEDSRKIPVSAVIADFIQPVPHFTGPSTQNSMARSDRRRPGSSGSLASIALGHTLKRSDSAALSMSGSPGRWGSMVSSLWSNRRVSSTDDSEMLSTSQEGSSALCAMDDKKFGKLSQMVEEALTVVPGNVPTVPGPSSRNNLKPIVLQDALRSNIQDSQAGVSAARSIPRKPRVDKVPLKLSYNEADGFMDIEMPYIRSVTSSMESSLDSVHTPNQASDGYNEHCSPYGTPITTDSSYGISEPVSDVAGWLRTFHPDFELQAVHPYDRLREDIKQVMRSESRQESLYGSEGNHNWQAVCSTLIADTTTFSVQCLTLHRKARKASSNIEPTGSVGSLPHSSRNAISNQFEEKFTEELVMDMDSTLIDAVEGILAQKGVSSGSVPSRTPSPSSNAGRTCTRIASRPSSVREYSLTVDPQTVSEVPHSQCKKMILGALEEVVRSVLEEQRESRDDGRKGSKRIKEKAMPDSTLREGVRKWLADIDES